MARAGVYRALIGARIRSDLQYRVSFITFTFSQFVITFLDYLAVLVVFHNVPRLAGWDLGEVTFLYGLANFSFGLADVFVSPVETVQVAVRSGEFDRLLLRPISPLIQVIADGFSARRVGKLLQGVSVFAVGAGIAHIQWTALRVAMTGVSIITGAVIFGALWVLTTCICFWWVDAREAANAVTYGGNFMAQYPLGVYGSNLRRILGFVVPIAFANYFPAAYVLGRSDRFGAPSWISFLAPVVALVVAGLAAMTWRFAVRHYRSTGS